MSNRVLLGVVLCCASACANDVPPVTSALALALTETEEPVYPAGPYGTAVGGVIKNLVINGFVDDDGDTYAFNDAPRDFELAEYFSGNDAESKVIMLNISVSWCAPCQQEAKFMRAADAEYRPQGARIFTVMLDDATKTKAWADKYDLPFPVLADATEQTGVYLTATPLNMFIDPTNMKILKKVYGGDYEPSLQYYLQNL